MHASVILDVKSTEIAALITKAFAKLAVKTDVDKA